MKGIMIVSGQCPPCQDLQEKYKEQIASKEIEVVSLETEPEKVRDLMNKYEMALPGLLIVANNGEAIAVT